MASIPRKAAAARKAAPARIRGKILDKAVGTIAGLGAGVRTALAYGLKHLTG